MVSSFLRVVLSPVDLRHQVRVSTHEGLFCMHPASVLFAVSRFSSRPVIAGHVVAFAPSLARHVQQHVAFAFSSPSKL